MKRATKQLPKQVGFSLVTAIFLLAVLAVLMVNMVNLGVGQQATVVMSIQGARALQAARSGLEFAIHQALVNNSCPASQTINFQAAEPALQGFSVLVQCDASVHTEGAGPAVTVYYLDALAQRGSYALGSNANPDYVSRRLRVTVSNNPP
jgi:MSHA biogenesis protein MshP